MINLFKKITGLFGSTLEQTIEHNLKDFEINQLQWMALSLNANMFHQMSENQQLTLEDSRQKIFYRLGDQKFHFGKTPGSDYKGSPDSPAFKLSLELMDAGLMWMTSFPTQFLKQDKPQGISEAEELKAFEWLRVSFVVLKEAMDDLLKELEQSCPSEQLFQAQLFAGHRNGCFEWRLLLFQLDIQLIFQKDGGLLCSVYNDIPHQPSKGPAHRALYYAQRGPVFDLMVELINKTSLLSRAYLSRWEVSAAKSSM